MYKKNHNGSNVMGGQAHAWMDFTNVRIAKSDKKKEKKGVYIIPMLNELFVE